MRNRTCNPLHILYFFLLSTMCFIHSASAEDNFLDVNDAFVLSISQSDKQAVFNWKIADGYYLYGDKLRVIEKKDGQKITSDLVRPQGKIKYDENFGEELEVFYGELTASTKLVAGQNDSLLSVRYQGCADAGLCYPPQTRYFSYDGINFAEITKVAFNSSSIASSSKPTETLNTAESSEAIFLPYMLLGALLGGFILNLMPCVFPVLSLKALSLSYNDGTSHIKNGWAYTAGIVLSFLLVAVIIITAKQTGESLGWGFQLQQPVFVAALVYLFLILGLNLAGFFEMGTSFMGVGQKLTQGNSTSASFFTGVLAAVVASPCTAPFMASAVGFAVTQSATTALLVFTFLGLGLAAPYLVLCHLPSVAKKMPNPGPWMERFKQLLSFPMFLTSAWLLGVLASQTSGKTAAYVVAGCVAVSFAIWVVKGDGSKFWRWLNRAFAAGAATAAIAIVFSVDKGPSEEDALWLDYSEETIAHLRSEKRAVFVDLTADWCITCKANEAMAINRKAVHLFAEENDIALVRGDWTSNDKAITKYLESFGRNGVPLYIVYPEDSNESPQVLPQILTEDLVLDALRQAVSDAS